MIGMTNSGPGLLEGWRQRLADCEAAAADEASTFGWLWRVKARIYRFLLARYGEGDWRRDATGPEASETSQSLVVREPLPEQASGPKSGERIHATLDRVHASVPAIEKGTYQVERPVANAWYPAGRVYRDEVRLRRAVEKLLRQDSIAYQWLKTRAGFVLQVHGEHQEQARDMLQAMKQELPRPTLGSAVMRNPFTAALVFILILAECFWIGMLALLLRDIPWVGVLLMTAGVVLGLLAGSWIGWWARRVSEN